MNSTFRSEQLRNEDNNIVLGDISSEIWIPFRMDDVVTKADKMIVSKGGRDSAEREKNCLI